MIFLKVATRAVEITERVLYFDFLPNLELVIT